MSVATLSTNTIIVQRKTITQDASGGIVETWANHLTMRASVQPLSARELALYDRETEAITHKIYVSGAPDITHADRIRFKSKTYAIRGVRNPDERDRFLTIHAELLT